MGMLSQDMMVPMDVPVTSGLEINWILVGVITGSIILGIVVGILLGRRTMKKRDI